MSTRHAVPQYVLRAVHSKDIAEEDTILIGFDQMEWIASTGPMELREFDFDLRTTISGVFAESPELILTP